VRALASSRFALVQATAGNTRSFHSAANEARTLMLDTPGALDARPLWGDESVLESDPPRRLVVGWRSLYHPEFAGDPASRVIWESSPKTAATAS
jgi:hypothetical protein